MKNEALMKHLETIGLFYLCGVLVAICNMVGYQVNLIDTLVGVFVLATICVVGYLVSLIPILSKLAMLFWISVVGILASTPLFPYYQEVIDICAKVQFIAIITPILAYAGLGMGKDIEMFKKFSWRIIPVAMSVFVGTFLFAAIMAHFTLHWSGVY